MGKHIREERKRRQEKRQMNNAGKKDRTVDIEIGEERKKTRTETQKNKENTERQRTVETLKIHRQVKSGEVSLQKERKRDFPGGPVAENPHFHCRGHGLDPGLGSKILHAMWPHTQKIRTLRGR